MDIKQIFNRSKPPKLTTEDVVCITPAGREFDNNNAYGGEKSQVLHQLAERGNVTIRELASRCRLPVADVEDCVEEFIRLRYANKVSFESPV